MVHSITLQTYDGTITDNDILGQICFAAPNEQDFAAGAVTASIFARSETAFDNDDNNETELVFATASGGATGARPAADLTGDMILSSAGLLTVAGGITSTAASNTLGATSFSDLNITNVGNIALDSISADGSALSIDSNWDAAGVTCSDLGIVTTVDINGGTIDGTTIGVSTQSTGQFTTVDATTDFTVGGTVITDGTISDTGTFIIDAATNIELDSGGGMWIFEDSGTTVLSFLSSGSGNVTVKLETDLKDLIFTDNNGDEGFRILDAAKGVSVVGDVRIAERADHAQTVASGYGQLWVKTGAPCELYFTNESGDDIQITSDDALAIGTVDISANTNLAASTGITLTGDTLTTNDGQIVHDNLSGFVANEHIDWTGASAGTIHATNYTNTTYSEATTSAEGLMSTAHHDKLDGIEASADVTDATNVTAAGALMDSEVTNLAFVKALAKGISDGNVLTANDAVADNDFLRIDGTEVEGLTVAEVLTALNVEAGADVTDATNVTAAGALMDSECAGLAALKATTGTFLSADESKLDGIEASADVTDATNVAAAGALMDSEVTNLAIVKALAIGISDGNFLTSNGAVADNDWLRIDGTEVEGRSDAEIKSDLGLGSAAYRAAEDTLTDGSNLPDGAAIKAYGDANWAGGGSSDLDATTDSGTIDIDLDSETLTVAGGTGIDTSATGTTITVAVDVSDFMATGANNRVLTAVDADSFQGESNLTFGGGDLLVGGSTPSVTIGDAGSEDTKLVFDGAAQDFYIGLDDTDDDLKIGLGSAVGTTPVITMEGDGDLSVGVDDTGYDVKLFGATAGRYWMWDEDQDGVRLRGNFVQEAVPVSNAGHTVVEGTSGNTIDIDWAAGNYHWVKLGASNISKIIFRNMKRGGRYILRIQQGGTARTIAESAWTGMVSDDSDTAFTELRWVGGDPPTMSTGTSSTDVYGFLGTRSNGLGCDAFVIAQDLQDSIT